MKHFDELQTGKARDSIVEISEGFLAEKSKSYWFTHSLLGKSDREKMVSFLKDLKQSNSVSELVIKIGEAKVDGDLKGKLSTVIVEKIYQTSPQVIEALGKEIAAETFYGPSYGAPTPYRVPNIEAAIDQLFQQYFKEAQTFRLQNSVELS